MAEPEQAVTDLSAFRARARTEAQPESSGQAPGRVGTEGARTPALPAGTVTFLLTDIEGSTRAWVAHGAAMAEAVARHYEILDAAIAGHGGVRPIEQGEGDSLVAAFAHASDAVAAALEAQRGLLEEGWPDGAEIAVRMALHTGEAGLRDERYYLGPTIIRCARLRALAHGGQVLISNTTADLLADGLPAGAALLPLGVHRLRDLHRPERVFQLSHPALPVDFPPLRSLDVLPNNLPVQLTSFVGRETELAELRPLVSEHRVVTLVGAGGCGKTRLAAQAAFFGGFSLEAAEEIAAGDPLESWEVLTLLSDLVDKSLVGFDGDRYRLLQTVRDFAGGKLDEAGEVRSVRDRHAGSFLGMAEAAADRLASGPRADTLAALEGDHDNLRAALQWVLATGDSERALRFVVALTLFWKIHGHYSEGESWCRRALSAAPADSSPLRARALWGLGHLSLYGMELGSGYGMADTEQATTLARQLGDPGLLARPLADQGVIGIFISPDAGVATLEEALQAAREAGDGWALASALGFLAFLWTFDRDRPDLARPYLDELHAIAGLSHDTYWPVWYRMCVGITAWHEGRLSDARQTLEAAHAGCFLVGDPHLEAWCVAWLSDVLIATGEYEEARASVARSLDWQRRSAACRSEMVQIYGGRAALAQGDLVEARRQAEDITGYLREYGIPFYISQCDIVLGRVALEEGDLAAAKSAFRTASDYGDRFASPWALVEAHSLQGRLARAEGDPAAAEDRHHRALALCVQYGFRGMAAESLEALAALADLGESHAEAARLFGAAQALRESTGQRRWPLDQPGYDAHTAAVRAGLGDDAFDQAWKEGAALGLEEAAAYASRARGERKRPSTGWGALTPTELEVVALAAQGLTNAEIGARLFMSSGTAKIHLSHIYTKLGVANRAALAARATARGVSLESGTDSARRT